MTTDLSFPTPPAATISAEYLKTSEAAKYLSVSRQWLEIGRHKGYGPSYVKLARMVRYSITDLDVFMRGNIRQNTIGGEI
jgi:hypothetical protein